MSMAIDIKAGEVQKLALASGETISLKLVQKSGQQARIEIDAPASVRIIRPEKGVNHA